MARLLAPEGYVPTGRSEEEIRERMNLIPMMLLLSANTSLESREAVRLAWWEEIVLRQRDVDEEEAYEENERKG